MSRSRTWSARSHRSVAVARAVVGVILVALVGASSGCAHLQAQRAGAEVVSQQPPPLADGTLLEVTEWGVLNGMVSVMVRNNSDRTLSRAEARITLLGEDGGPLAAAPAVIEGDCCVAVDVPPHASYGFYLDAGDTTGLDDVRVRFGNVVTPRGGPIEAAVLQAVLDGPDGEFLAVVSGTWFCFLPAAPREVSMQLYEAVPPGTTIRSVAAFPRPISALGGDANVEQQCSPPEAPAAPPTEG